MSSDTSDVPDRLGPGDLQRSVLTFVTSVRHPHNSADYRRTVALLQRTLRSLDAQEDRRCRVVVVLNEPLDVPSGVRIPVEQVVVDFPPPSPQRGPRTGIPAVLLDKGSKLALGVSRVREGHVMFVDADDYVSRRITGHVAAHPAAPGWYVDEGLMYDRATGLVADVARFNEVCGTSLIVRRDLLPAMDFSPDIEQGALVARLGRDVVFEQFGSHRHLAGSLHLAPLPFAGAAYSVSTGENHSGKRLTSPGRVLDADRAADLGLHRRPAFLRRATALVRSTRRTAGRARRRISARTGG